MSNIDFKYDDRGWLHVISKQKVHQGAAHTYHERDRVIPGSARTEVQRFIRPAKDIDRPTIVWSVTSSFFREDVQRTITDNVRFRNRNHAEAWLRTIGTKKAEIPA